MRCAMTWPGGHCHKAAIPVQRIWHSFSPLRGEVRKDIDVVMQDASDLVEVIHTLTSIVNFKG